MTLRDKILNSKIISTVYKTLTYFEKGKTFFARFYGSLPEMFIIVGGLKYLFGVNLSTIQVIVLILSLFLIFFLNGLFVVKYGLVDVEQVTDVMRNPVQREIYLAAKVINDEKKNKGG